MKGDGAGETAGPVKRDGAGESGRQDAYGFVWLSLDWGDSVPPDPPGLLERRISSYRLAFGIASADRSFCCDSSRAASVSAGARSDGSFAEATMSSRRTRCSSCPPPTDHFTA